MNPVTKDLDLDAIGDKAARDVLRRAASESDGGPVWITEDGHRIAAIVGPELAYTVTALASMTLRRDLREFLAMRESLTPPPLSSPPSAPAVPRSPAS